MTRSCLLSAIALAVVSLGGPRQTEAQTPISMDALQAAQVAAGTARVLGTPVLIGDSVIISLEDADLTSEALTYGGWRLGGRDGSPRAVGRTIAEAMRSGLPEPSRVKVVVVEVAGSATPGIEPGSELRGGARVSFPYHFAGP